MCLTTATASFPSFATLAFSSLGIAQQFLLVLLFVSVFVHLYLGRIEAPQLIWAGCGVAVCLLCVSFGHRRKRARSAFALRQIVPSFAVLALTLHALSPVLRTLGEATTSDSIWALTAMLFGGHLALADYSMHETKRPLFSSTLSLNLAMCASVVLSSRLAWDLDVFALLLTALLLFALFPLLRQRIYLAWGHADGSWAALPITALLAAADLYLLYPVSKVVDLVLLPSTLVFLTILCPWWMRRAQRWKQEMRGPWDEAVLPPA